MTEANLKTLKIAHSVINFTFFVVGALIVWNVTHDWMAMGGMFVAALHFDLKSYLS